MKLAHMAVIAAAAIGFSLAVVTAPAQAQQVHTIQNSHTVQDQIWAKWELTHPPEQPA
jgi:hypothetical protein